MPPPPELLEALSIDLTRKPTLTEWAALDAEWHQELVAAMNAYVDERQRVQEANAGRQAG